ncbi:uncharacterized protein EKO05_0001912 [Ascochyta rabiei]|uniref:Uncharacterized protein n=1 Tax=Didymella rabiei TaxID=5454 RepID=A0A163I3C2_DIDRA|nr:uncharacterized protein EKO05_0001912 [Ascochyta rabiei]KZM25588.1 hypothetical protein ST47_g3292 [Ascochyta rabiei]UPX11301.1 hypothetical protein EKO05_0001912 [Ascochyta rabiei]
MKGWNGHGDALVAPPRAPAGSRFLTAAFAAFVMIAALDTIFPSLKHHLIPEQSGRPSSEPGHAAKSFQWSLISPQTYLEFHECFDGFECAKLSLPLDYFNGTYPNDTVNIAVAKLPAKVSVNDPRYGGPILLNPGGPGGPGALFALSIAKSLQLVVDGASDPDLTGRDARFFDIIGFDPRGIGETEPAAACISDPASAWSWRLRETEEGILGSSDAALGRLWSMTHAFGSSCKQASDAEDGPDIKQYMTTAFVARDMLEIVEKHAEHVAQQAAQAKHNQGRRTDCPNAGHMDYEPGRAKLQYWGFSYGTLLGSTFASMFPDRVGRVVLDGVVNDYDYNHSLGNGSLVDNDKAMKSFYSYCLLAGVEACPLAENATTFTEIKDRIQKIVMSLYHNPFMLSSAEGPEVFTYSDLRAAIFSTIYQPQISFPVLGNLLPQIEAGSGDLIDLLQGPFRDAHTISCGVNGSVTNPVSYTADVSTVAILCADGIDHQGSGIDEFVEYWEFLRNMSTTAGDVWAILKMKCMAWKIRPSHKFEDEFGASTSNPVLFVSNTADPVTPLRSGRLMQSKFPNSALLINDQAGHCSFSVTNLCAYDRIKNYFQTGALPAPNTLCVPPPSVYSLNSTDPKSPFYDPSLQTSNQFVTDSEISIEHQKRHSAAKMLQRVMMESDAFGFSGLISGKRGTRVQRLAAARKPS